MNPHDIREVWERFWLETYSLAVESKQAQDALFEASRYYRTLSPVDQQVVDGLLAEWALSEDEARSFVGLALIREYGIRSALPALHRLRAHLERSSEPAAPYRKAKVNRIISALEEAPGGDAPV